MGAAGREEQGRRRARRTLVAGLIAIALVAAVVTIAARRDDPQDVASGGGAGEGAGTVPLLSPPGSDIATTAAPAPPRPPPSVPPEALGGGVFREPTGLVLLADDGVGGATAVDLDHRRAARRSVVGGAAGDQPYRFTRAGDQILVGWGEIWAADLATAASHRVAVGTIYVPDDDDSVWIVDWPGDGGMTGDPPTYRRVRLDGTVELEVPEPTAAAGPGSFTATRGVDGGLLFDTDDGIVLWDPATDRVLRRSTTGEHGRVIDVAGPRILWSDSKGLHLTDLADPAGAARPITFRDQPVVPDSAHLSPDGRQIALLTAADPSFGSATPATIVLVDTETGTAEPVYGAIAGWSGGQLRWSPDGSQLLFTSWSYLEGTTTVARLGPGSHELEIATLPFGGIIVPLWLERSSVGAWLAGTPATIDTCPPTTVYTPGRTTTPCAFDF